MTILARDVMQPHVVAVSADSTLAELADLLVDKRIGGVPVVQGGAVVGVVSRSDFARVASLERALAGLVAEAETREEFAPGETPDRPPLTPELAASLERRRVREIMVSAPITVRSETPIEEVARVLVANHLHRVLVVDDGALRGVISALDLVALVASRRLRAG